MAKKSKNRMPFATCLGCGANLKLTHKACPRCGRANLARNEAVKASIAPPAFIAKSASSLRCPGCNTAGRPGNRFCVRCGTQLQARVIKSVAEARRERLMADLVSSADPAYRQMLWYAAHPDLRQPGSAS